MSGLTPDQLAHNDLYCCCAVLSSPVHFATDGAVSLNHLLQERAGMTREQAFQIVADAIAAGLLRVDDANGKRLSVVAEAYVPFRDKHIEAIGAVQAEVVTMNWTMHAPSGLDDAVRDDLRRHVARGRLADLGGTRAGRAFIKIDKLLTPAVMAGEAAHIDGPALELISTEAQRLTDAVDLLTPDDYIIVIARTRDCGVVRSVKFFRSVDDKVAATCSDPR